MKVADVWNNVNKAKLIDYPNDVINQTLVRMAQKKFSLKEKFELAVVGVKPEAMAEMAACAKQVVDQDFNGDAKAALAFMRDVHQTGLAHLDFSDMVHQGAAHRLIALEKSNPAEFHKIVSGNYANVAELNTALGAPQQQASVTTRPKFQSSYANT